MRHPHMSSQQNKSMTTSHFDMFLHIQVIYKCMAHVSMCKYPCWLNVYSYFDCGRNEFGGLM